MIVKESWGILRQDKEIMWFPVLSAIVSIIALTVMAAGLYFMSYQGGLSDIEQSGAGSGDLIFNALLFVYYLVMFFIVSFFEAGIYIIAHGRFNGQDLSFGDGMRGALACVPQIFAWSCISATVGVILHAIAERSKIVGRIVSAILGAAWNILTFFSLPSLVIGKTTVTGSFKESAAAMRKTWGEVVIVNLGVGAFFMLLVFLGLAAAIGTMVLVPDALVIICVIALTIVYLMLLMVVSSALGSIFKLALYEYATTGKVPQGFSQELIASAIQKK